MSLKWKEMVNYLISFNSHSGTRTPLSDPSPTVQSMSVYSGWQDQLRPHPKLRSFLSPNFHHPLFYLGALADKTRQGVEPGNAWCGKRRVWQPFLVVPSDCWRMVLSDAQFRSRQPHLQHVSPDADQEPAKIKPACKGRK